VKRLMDVTDKVHREHQGHPLLFAGLAAYVVSQAVQLGDDQQF
jgi:hypothetical protein